jgi:murein L,D-transpeptidase YafK
VTMSRTTGSAAIVVDKVDRRLLLYEHGRVALSVPVELGANGLRRKQYAGDRATPEGRYRITVKKQGASTRYHKALLIDYPNRDDLRRFESARADGTVPVDTGPGSLIEIHGGGGRDRDWTDGCVALTDRDMDRIFDRVKVGTPVVIVGTSEEAPGGAK